MPQTPQPTARLSGSARRGRTFLKRYMYSQLTVLSGLKVALGREAPVIRFTVEDDPPSTYWVFRMLPTKLDDLIRRLDLPPGLELCPITCLDGEEPEFWLSLNVYRVSGLASAIRAEWSVFVADGSGFARYLIVDARSSSWSVEPIQVITKASTVEHERRGDGVHTRVGEGDAEFRSTIAADAPSSVVHVSRDWVSANDYIYWANGICDRTFYDAGLANAPQLLMGPEGVDVHDGTPWHEFVEPAPSHVLVMTNPIEFLISPWDNLGRRGGGAR